MENSKQYNAIYSCCISEPWLDVASKMKSELNIHPAYFIGWKKDNSSEISKQHPNCFYQEVEDAWKGIGFPKLDYNFSFDEEIMKSIAYEKSIALKMMDRLDLGRNTFTYSNREIFFHRLLKYWMTITEYYQIDLIISPSIPHRVFDYVLYIVAKIKNIEIVMFQMSSFQDSSFLTNDIFNTPKYLKEYIQNNNSKNEVLRADIIEKLKQTTKDYSVAIPQYMVKQQEDADHNKFINRMKARIKNLISNPLEQFEKDDTYYIMKSDDLPNKKDNIKLCRKIAKYRNAYYLKSLKKEYSTISITPDYQKPYLFIAFHYQPEETSNPTGGIFENQILIIELLNNFLDKKYQIYIKEHKTQFYPAFDGALSRNKNYYSSIAEISDRIHFIDMKTSPFDLIDSAVATVTISGTTGWESAIRGTPSLIFGRSWYEDMPGVFKIKSVKDLEENWENILALKNNILTNDIEEYHKKLQHFFIEAPHYKFFQGRVDRTAEENCNNIFNGLKNHLERLKFFI